MNATQGDVYSLSFRASLLIFLAPSFLFFRIFLFICSIPRLPFPCDSFLPLLCFQIDPAIAVNRDNLRRREELRKTLAFIEPRQQTRSSRHMRISEWQNQDVYFSSIPIAISKVFEGLYTGVRKSRDTRKFLNANFNKINKIFKIQYSNYDICLCLSQVYQLAYGCERINLLRSRWDSCILRITLRKWKDSMQLFIVIFHLRNDWLWSCQFEAATWEWNVCYSFVGALVRRTWFVMDV